jgi:hypothetical protein
MADKKVAKKKTDGKKKVEKVAVSKATKKRASSKTPPPKKTKSPKKAVAKKATAKKRASSTPPDKTKKKTVAKKRSSSASPDKTKKKPVAKRVSKSKSPEKKKAAAKPKAKRASKSKSPDKTKKKSSSKAKKLSFKTPTTKKTVAKKATTVTKTKVGKSTTAAKKKASPKASAKKVSVAKPKATTKKSSSKTPAVKKTKSPKKAVAKKAVKKITKKNSDLPSTKEEALEIIKETLGKHGFTSDQLEYIDTYYKKASLSSINEMYFKGTLTKAAMSALKKDIDKKIAKDVKDVLKIKTNVSPKKAKRIAVPKKSAKSKSKAKGKKTSPPKPRSASPPKPKTPSPKAKSPKKKVQRVKVGLNFEECEGDQVRFSDQKCKDKSNIKKTTYKLVHNGRQIYGTQSALKTLQKKLNLQSNDPNSTITLTNAPCYENGVANEPGKWCDQKSGKYVNENKQPFKLELRDSGKIIIGSKASLTTLRKKLDPTGKNSTLVQSDAVSVYGGLGPGHVQATNAQSIYNLKPSTPTFTVSSKIIKKASSKKSEPEPSDDEDGFGALSGTPTSEPNTEPVILSPPKKVTIATQSSKKKSDSPSKIASSLITTEEDIYKTFSECIANIKNSEE